MPELPLNLGRPTGGQGATWSGIPEDTHEPASSSQAHRQSSSTPDRQVSALRGEQEAAPQCTRDSSQITATAIAMMTIPATIARPQGRPSRRLSVTASTKSIPIVTRTLSR